MITIAIRKSGTIQSNLFNLYIGIRQQFKSRFESKEVIRSHERRITYLLRTFNSLEPKLVLVYQFFALLTPPNCDLSFQTHIGRIRMGCKYINVLYNIKLRGNLAQAERYEYNKLVPVCIKAGLSHRCHICTTRPERSGVFIRAPSPRSGTRSPTDFLASPPPLGSEYKRRELNTGGVLHQSRSRMVDITLLVTWNWFQAIAIRLAIVLAILTLGPSVGLILFDLVYYVVRTTYQRIPVLAHRKMDGKVPADIGLKTMEKSLHVREHELEHKEVG